MIVFQCSVFTFVCICADLFNIETKRGKGEGLIYVSSCIDYDMALFSGGTMVRPSVKQEKSGGSLLAWCLYRLMTGSYSDWGRASWDRPLHHPHWWPRPRKIVGDGANDGPKPHGYFEGQDL